MEKRHKKKTKSKSNKKRASFKVTPKGKKVLKALHDSKPNRWLTDEDIFRRFEEVKRKASFNRIISLFNFAGVVILYSFIIYVIYGAL